MRTFWQDLRYAARCLARQPGFAVGAVLMLAVGAGASGALWGLIEVMGWRARLAVPAVAVALLLPACVNTAYLLLERGLGRRREMAIRAALGAGRARLMRQLLTESLLVGALGGAAGLIVAIWAMATVVKLGAPGLPALAAIRLNERVVAATLAFALAGGVAVGLLPAWDSSQAEMPVLGRERRRFTLPAHLRGRGLLATAQMALAAVLLACTGDMAHGPAGLRQLDTLLVGGLAVLAMAQAGLGIYGAMSWAVAVRTPEFRIRLALGARGADLRRLVLRQGLRLALEGTGLGLAAGWLAAPLPADPAVLVSVSILLTGVAILACHAPARRAAQVDPLAAIRYE